MQVTNIDDDIGELEITPINNNTAEVDTLASNVGGAFSVKMVTIPRRKVVVHVESADETEGVVFANDTRLTFTPDDWDVAQTVHVLGVDDAVVDGDMAYKIVVKTPARANFDSVAQDPGFADMYYEVDMINLDDDVASVYATIVKGNTSEAGESGSFMLRLTSEPTSSVIFRAWSSDINEATALPSIPVLGPDTWDIGVLVTATGRSDNKDDGDTPFNITVMPIVSDDELYKSQPALHVPFVNFDDPINKFTLLSSTSPAACQTSESGGECSVLVTTTNWFAGGMGFPAFKKVTVTLTTDDPTEGKPVNSAGVTKDSVEVEFDAASSAATRTVVIRGIDDTMEDFDVSYHISLTATLETEDEVVRDIAVSKISPPIDAVNIDNNTAGLVISAPSALQTTESGDVVTFTARLSSKPSETVSLQVLSNSTEAAVTTGAALTFTPTNWDTAQEVIVTGQNDDLIDGDQYYHIYGNSGSTDVAYDSLNFVQLRMTNIDNDQVSTSLNVLQDGVQLAGKLSQNVHETGTNTTFQVGLSAAPSDVVTVFVTSDDLTEGLVSPASLVFDANNWNTVQDIMVTGQDDLLADGNSVFAIDLSVESQDTTLNGTIWKLETANMEDDVLRLSQHSCRTTEAGGTCTVEVSIFDWPADFEQLEIALASSDTTEGNISVSHIVIESGNWSTPTVVTITGVDDDVDDGNILYQVDLIATLKYRPAGASAPITKEIRAETVQVTNMDDDTAGLDVVQMGTVTDEAGTTKCNITVALLTEPSGTAILKPVSMDPTEGSFDVTSLLFYKFNWNVPQTIVVSGVNDFVKDGDIVYQIKIMGADALSGNSEEYRAVTQLVPFTNLDDDVVGINIEMIESITTESGDKASFRITLNSEPIAAVIYTLTTDDATEGQVETSIIVVLAPDNWNTGSLVEVKGQPDSEADGDVVYHIAITPVISDDPKYKALPAKNVALTNLDDPATQVQLLMSPYECVTTEDGGICPVTLNVTGWYMGDSTKARAKYRNAFEKLTVVLTSANVGEGLLACVAGDSACLSSGGDSAGNSLTLVFTADGIKTVNVVGQDDTKVDGDIRFAVSASGVIKTGDDADVEILSSQMTKEISVLNMDNDIGGLVLTSHCFAGGMQTTELGDYCLLTTKLASAPAFGIQVAVDASSTDETEGTVSGGCTDDPPGWSAAGENCGVYQTNEYCTSTGAYGTGWLSSYGLFSDWQDAVAAQDASQACCVCGGGAGSPLVLDFTNWNTGVVVTVTGVDDSTVDGDQSYNVTIVTTCTQSAQFNALVSTTSFVNLDNDVDGLLLNVTQDGSEIVGSSDKFVSETGVVRAFNVSLKQQPSAPVTVLVSSSLPTEGMVSPDSLVFTPANWNATQPVTVTGVDDNLQDGDTSFNIVLETNSSASAFSGIVWRFRMINLDDEVLRAKPVNHATTCFVAETGTTCMIAVSVAAFPAFLTRLDVVATSADLTEGVLNQSALSFDHSNWQQTQHILVTGLDDKIDDGDIVFNVELASSLTYTAIDDASVIASKSTMTTLVSVSNQDNDESGVAVQQYGGGTVTDEAGTVGLWFTFKLLTEPTGEVRFPITISPTREAAASVTELWFTPTDWDTPKSVNITGKDDDVVDGTVAYNVIIGASASADANYAEITRSLAYTNTDNDVAQINVETYNTATNEGGGTVILKVTLNSEPTAAVVFTSSTNDFTEALTNPSIFVLAPDNWKAGQWVTITGVGDTEVDGDVEYEFSVNVIVSDDTDYMSLPTKVVTLTNMDKPSNKLIVSSDRGTCVTSEDHGTCPVMISISGWYFGSNAWDNPPDGGSPSVPSALYQNPIDKVVVTIRSSDVTEASLFETYDAIPGVRPNGLAPELMITFTNDACLTANTTAPTSAPTAEGDTPTGAPTAAPTHQPTIWAADRCWRDGLNFTLYGEDDEIVELTSPHYYVAITASVTMGDGQVDQRNLKTIIAVNEDNDVADVFIVGLQNGLPVDGYYCDQTSETLDECSFQLKLGSQPRADVTFTANVSDSTEGVIVTGAKLIFTPLNWNDGLVLTVRGVDDEVVDGDITYNLQSSMTSADISYNNLPLRYGAQDPTTLQYPFMLTDLNLTNLDNDVQQVNVYHDRAGTLTPIAGQADNTDEAGKTSVVFIKLDVDHPLTGDNNVTIALNNSRPTEVSLSVTTLFWSTANWSDSNQVGFWVTMTGLNDDDLDGDQTVVITLNITSGDDYYNKITDFRLVNVDDDALVANLGLVFEFDRRLTEGEPARRRLATTVSACQTTEAGGVCQTNLVFGVWMSSWMNCVVTVRSLTPSEGTVAVATYTFTGPETFVIDVTGANDYIADGDQTYLIETQYTLNCQPSAGNCLNSNTLSTYTFAPNFIQFTNTDDDVAGVDVAQVAPWTGMTSEAGVSQSYDIKLTSEPTSAVTISIVSLDSTEGQPSLDTLTFTASNWQTAQRVAVVGQNDDVYDLDIDYNVMVGPSTSSDDGYSNKFGTTHTLQNLDDDMYSLHVDWTAKNGTKEENAKTSGLGQTTTYTIRLGSEPKASTIITAFSKDGAEAEVSPSIIVLAADNWKEGKEITVTGKNEGSPEGDVMYQLEITPIIGDAEYQNLVPAVYKTLINYDDPVNLLTIDFNSTTCTLKETGMNCVLKFQLSYWYDAMTYPFTNPFYKVKVTASTGDSTEAKLLEDGLAKDSTEMLFDSTNWNTPTYLTILAVDDFLVDGDIAFNVDLEAEIYSAGRSSWMVQPSKMPSAIACTNMDNDVAELLIVPSDGVACTTTSESDLGSNGGCVFDVSLKSQPLAGTSVEVVITSSDVSEGTATTPATGTMVFTTANWMTPQEMKVQGTEDVCGVPATPCYEGGPGTFEAYTINLDANSADPNWVAMSNFVMSMQNEDNDNVALDIKQNGVLISGGTPLAPVDELGATSTFTVVLQTLPTAAVTVTLTVDDATEILLSTGQLVFQPDASFATEQSVTITGLDDTEPDGDVTAGISMLLTSSDAAYIGVPASTLSIVNYDDDMLVVLNSTGTTTEAGGTFTFGIKMRSWRSDFELFKVYIPEKVGPPTSARVGTYAQTQVKEGAVSTAGGLDSVYWDANNYDDIKYIVVTGLDDFLDDGDQTYTINLVSFLTPVGGGAAKQVATLAVTVTNTDDDTSDLLVVQINNHTSEKGGPWPGGRASGGTATFTVRPTSEPFTDMRIQLSSSDTTEGVLDNSELFFTPTTWTVPQQITVTGVDDFVYDYPQPYQININSAPSSSDLNYRGQQPKSLEFINDDDDKIGLVVSKIVTRINGTTSENKLFTAKLLITLTSEPKDTILFTVMSDDPTEATTNPNIIAFSDTTWMLPQEVMIVGVDDPQLDGDMSYSVVVKTMYTNDPDYGHYTTGMLTETRQFINLDESSDVAVTECPLGMWGTVVAATGQLNCASCPAGRYSDTTKNVTRLNDCKTCYFGTYSDVAKATAKSQCLPCPAGTFNNLLAQTECQTCDNHTYCGVATVVPLVGVDVLQLQTGYLHGWQLVSAASFTFNFTWFDPQYFRNDKVVTQNSVQMLWFGLVSGVAFAVCVALYLIASRNAWVHNYVRSLDIFNDEHYEDPRPDSDGEEDDDDDDDDDDYDWDDEDMADGDDEDGEDGEPKKHKRRFVSSIRLTGGGMKEVNGIYERVLDSENEDNSDGVARYAKSAEKTKRFTTNASEGDLVIKRYTINGTRYALLRCLYT
jgi:hypothetical protein